MRALPGHVCLFESCNRRGRISFVRMRSISATGAPQAARYIIILYSPELTRMFTIKTSSKFVIRSVLDGISYFFGQVTGYENCGFFFSGFSYHQTCFWPTIPNLTHTWWPYCNILHTIPTLPNAQGYLIPSHFNILSWTKFHCYVNPRHKFVSLLMWNKNTFLAWDGFSWLLSNLKTTKASITK